MERKLGDHYEDAALAVRAHMVVTLIEGGGTPGRDHENPRLATSSDRMGTQKPSDIAFAAFLDYKNGVTGDGPVEECRAKLTARQYRKLSIL